MLGSERVNLELGDGTIGITTDSAGDPVHISSVAHESPTLIVSVDDRVMTDIERSAEPQTAIRDAALAGDIDYRATTVTGRLRVGAVKFGLGVYNAVRQVGMRLPL